MNRAKQTTRKAVRTCLLVLFAALATVSIGAFAQQGSNKSANSQQHAPGADYSHRIRSPAIIPDIPGFGPEGRPNYGGCDAADVTMGRNGCGEQPRPPVCNDPNASNRGQQGDCICNTGFVWNGSACQDNICRDADAENFGKELPCKPKVCKESDAANYGDPLPCLCADGQPMVNGVCDGGGDKPPEPPEAACSFGKMAAGSVHHQVLSMPSCVFGQTERLKVNCSHLAIMFYLLVGLPAQSLCRWSTTLKWSKTLTRPETGNQATMTTVRDGECLIKPLLSICRKVLIIILERTSRPITTLGRLSLEIETLKKFSEQYAQSWKFPSFIRFESLGSEDQARAFIACSNAHITRQYTLRVDACGDMLVQNNNPI